MKKIKKVILILLGTILLIFIVGKIAIGILVNNVNNIPVNMPSLSDVPDGNYVGEYLAKPVYVKVNVFIKEHKIIDIEILEHDNGFGSSAESIVNDVINNQSLDVDVVSGATVSSKCILKAVENSIEADSSR